jgi:RinA family phage transcriptional activator
LTKKNNWKVSDSDFDFIQDEVELYPKYKEKIEELINEYAYSVPERDTNGGGRSNLPSRPVENTTYKLMDDIQLQKMRRYVKAVEDVFHSLDLEKQKFIHAYFWRKGPKDIQAICKEFSISQATHLRWKKAFLLQVGLYTGDKRDL